MNDFFDIENVSEKKETRAPSAPSRQFLRSTCECGAGGGWRMVQHYEIVQCNCGKRFWALQPHRDGPFVAYLWPGLHVQERRAA